MTPEKATALRKPFPPESVGRLPKPYKKDSPKGECRECGGYHGLPAVHLDYVGHAAATDRLLTVDPQWSWEPMALDQFGSPMTDHEGNLWIRLTVCGVTRIGCGDGVSMKERIGDAIRNAAMRFGVALDLWAKENLVEFAQQRVDTVAALQSGAQEAAKQAAPSSSAKGPKPLDVRGKLAKAMFAALNEAGVPDNERLTLTSKVIGREITTSKEMTEDDARKVLNHLDALDDAKGDEDFPSEVPA